MGTIKHLLKCMCICEFVLNRLTDFELDDKTQFFYQISSQIWPLTPTGRSQFLINIKNAFTSLIVESSCLFVPSFVHIVIAGSEWQAKTWFWGEIRSNFDLWPHRTSSNLWIMKKCHYKLVPRVKLLHCFNFCPHQNCRIWTMSQNVISGRN